VVVGLADLEILEIEAAAFVSLDRSNHQCSPKSFVVSRMRALLTIHLP
jgi:hypothetical protein